MFLFVVISVFANFILKNQFENYTKNRLQQTIHETVELISGRIFNGINKWDTTGISNIGMDVLGKGLLLRIIDNRGNVIWDARIHNNGMCMDILQRMAFNMESYDKNFQGGYQEETYPIIKNGIEAGSVSLGYYGPYFFSDNDIQFLGTLNNFLVWAAAGSFLICLIFGALLARHLTRPISRVIQATGRIAEGDYDSRIALESNTKEIVELTGSVNSLAGVLENQELLRKRLTADVAHELRTPLATLQSHMEAMIDGIWKPEKPKLVSCHEEILRLTKLVGELETLSRYEAENMTLQIERFNISELVKRILGNFESKFREKSITPSFSGEEVWIEADKDKLSQVFINLISNAAKFTPEGGNIEVNIIKNDEAVAIEIRDTGIGISQQDLPHVFERFYRTDKSRNRATGGFGIGLTIAKSIIKAHGGDITAASEEGKGSTFTVFLTFQTKLHKNHTN
ncbi:MAG: sensor histidine kinase [Burkholderiales bacterium]